MRSDIRKMKSRGFTLVELLIVVAIIGILAGLAMLAMGRSTDSTEATAIMANLEAAKSALLAYSMEHRTRTTDPLREFVVATDGEIIIASLDKYMDASLKSGGQSAAKYFKKDLSVRGDPLQVGFNNIKVTSALQKKIDASGGEYILEENTEGSSIWLRVR